MNAMNEKGSFEIYYFIGNFNRNQLVARREATQVTKIPNTTGRRHTCTGGVGEANGYSKFTEESRTYHKRTLRNPISCD